MKSVSGRSWEELNVTKRYLEKIKNENGFSEIVSKIIITNNFDNEEIHSITNKVDIINPFFKKKDFYLGKKILKKSIQDKEKIIIIGDYDVDGCISTSLMVNFLDSINYNNFIYYIPNRFKDGYGANLSAIKRLTKKKTDLIIFLDCGSTSAETINYLNQNKIKSLIIDHHDIFRPYPKADCIINPKKECDYNEFNYFCSSNLVYFFLDFYIKDENLKSSFEKNLIYVLLAILSDVMPLRKLNRFIALKVFENLNFQNIYIFNKILEIRKIRRSLNINDLAFLIGPIFNSVGRLYDANVLIKLLTSKNLNEKNKIINVLISANEKRKKIETDAINNINLDKISKNKSKVIVFYEINFNEGIIGILASRLKEYFNKPAIILTKVGDLYKASARSTSNFNIGLFIKQAIDKKIIEKGGGHNLAAGFVIKKKKIDIFTKFINNKLLNKDDSLVDKYLCKISALAINSNFYNDLKNLAPFGQANKNPFFLIDNVKIIKPKIINDKFVSFFIKSKSGKLIQGISFNLINSEITRNLLFNKGEINLIVQINENVWNNKKSLQLIVADIILHLNKA